MRFLVDEDVAIEVARCLPQTGHEVSLVAEALGVRTDAVDIWRHAARTCAIVVTCSRQDSLALAGTGPRTELIVLNRRRTRQAECRLQDAAMLPQPDGAPRPRRQSERRREFRLPPKCFARAICQLPRRRGPL